MKYKTAELIGAQLDYWVAKAEELPEKLFIYAKFRPSTRWADGGPIKDRHKISTIHHDNHVEAFLPAIDVSCPGDGHTWPMRGETELIAAMRCLVAKKYGDEVELM